MPLDLSSLDDSLNSVPADVASGKPLELPLADIEEDPDQPRKEFNAEAMAEMTASIKARGVRQPVSVRPHPSKAGKWMLNFGARRYRGSIAAGKTTIPAFIDETSNDFDQVIENEQRDNLTPMEFALFISRKMEDGLKKGEIAKRLGKDPAVITQHLALIAPPLCIEEIYRSGRCTSPKTLYELRALYDKYSEAVDAWCASGQSVTRAAVAALGESLKNPPAVAASPAVGSAAAEVTGTAAQSPMVGNGDKAQSVEPRPAPTQAPAAREVGREATEVDHAREIEVMLQKVSAIRNTVKGNAAARGHADAAKKALVALKEELAAVAEEN